MTPPQGAAPHTNHQGGAHQVPFNLDDAPTDLGPAHIYFNDLGDPHDPAAAEAAPPPAHTVDHGPPHDRFGDSASSDDDLAMEDTLSFVKGSATHGDVHKFAYDMLRFIRGGRKASYRLQDQLQAWASRCDKTTYRAIQTALTAGFRVPVGGGGRLYFTDADAALAAGALNAEQHAAGLPRARQASLELFAQWFKESFFRVEAAREARREIEYDFGQTQSLEHHNADFNELLDKLPTGMAALLATPQHIDHYLSSLSDTLPAELSEYDTPRKTVEDAHATLDGGDGYATLTLVQEAALTAERSVAAAARKLGLQQHWIDFAGRKTSAKGRKGVIGSVEMADAALTQSSARALMAGYADSAANKQAAELRREFGSRIETLETGLSTFSTQLQSVDTKIDRQHSELLQALQKKGKGGQGGKGKWRQQQQPLQPRFPQQQQQQWSQQPQWQQQAPQAGWQATVPAPQRQGTAAGQSWTSGRKPLACWGCGGPHMERNCPNKGTVDATRADTRHGANVCSLALSGDDSGEATLEEVEEKFGGLEEVRGFVNAVRAQSEAIMTAAVQQGGSWNDSNSTAGWGWDY